MTANQNGQAAPNRWLWLLLALVAALCLPLLLQQNATPYTWDEINYYLPGIARLRASWPALDLQHDSLSATAPGYQYLLAGLSQLTGNHPITLRFLNLGVSLSVLLVLWRIWPADISGRLRFAALLPLAASNFFIKSASYVVTDNAALLATTGTLALALCGRTAGTLSLAGLTAGLAVFFRQINVWLELPLLLCVLSTRRPWLLWVLLPPLGVLGLLVRAWGGLVPPAWQSTHSSGIILAAGAYQLAVLALLGPFYYAAVTPDWRAALRERWLGAGVILGLAFAVVAPTTPSYEAGRWGGYLWSLAAYIPAVGERSLLFLLLAPVGGGMLALLFRRLWTVAGREPALGWLAAVLGAMAVGLANRQIYQRYFEPPQLVLLVIWLGLLSGAAGRPELRWRPLLLLGAGQFCLTVATAYGRTFLGG